VVFHNGALLEKVQTYDYIVPRNVLLRRLGAIARNVATIANRVRVVYPADSAEAISMTETMPMAQFK
jgi:hypothetical protein